MRTKALLLALPLCLSFAAAEAAPARVQGNDVLVSSGTSGSITLSALGSGHAVAGCVLHLSTTTIASISDGTNAYTQVATGPFNGGLILTTFYKENVTAGPTSLTITTSGGAGPILAVADEFSGVSTSAATDGNAQGVPSGSTANSFTSGNLSPTPTVNGDLIYGCSMSATSATQLPGTGFTIGVNDNPNTTYSEWQVQATAGTIAATFTPSVSDNGWTNGVALQASGGGGGGVVHLRLTKGVGQ